MTSDVRPGQHPATMVQPEDGTRLSESLSNEEFIETYRALDSIQEKLSHEEFNFVRYLLKMVLLELDSHSNRSGDRDNQKKDANSGAGGQPIVDAC